MKLQTSYVSYAGIIRIRFKGVLSAFRKEKHPDKLLEDIAQWPAESTAVGLERWVGGNYDPRTFAA